MLNIAYNVLAGGRVLDDIELRRNDAAYLDMLGARAIPDPTTAADFCRRFDAEAVRRLMGIFNRDAPLVWRRGGRSDFRYFFYVTNDRDLTQAEVIAEAKAARIN